MGVPPESFSVVPSRAVPPEQDLDQLLSWALVPYNTCQNRGSTFRRPCLAHFVPPSGFGYPLGGLLPPKPGRACFIPTAFLGFSPSERSPLPRWPPRFHSGRTRMPLPQRDLPQANLRTGAKDTDFQALTLGRVPCREQVISPPRTGGSPGIPPFQGDPSATLPGLPPETPLTHFVRPARRQNLTRASGYRSATDWPDSSDVSEPTQPSRTTLLGFSCLLVPAG